MNVKFITPNEKTYKEYVQFLIMLDLEFHDLRAELGDDPMWKSFLAEKHERSKKLFPITSIRKQETEEQIRKQMVTDVKDSKGNEMTMVPTTLLLDTDPMTLINHGYLLEDQRKAIRGEAVPRLLDDQVSLSALIRGIRQHHDFATSEAVVRHSLSIPAVSRAFNARLIMSNQVPDKMDESEEPYCIWHPDLATEDTYRALALKFPNMRYQVGRACAAAGYYTLFKELELVPEVSIAEEARESQTEGGKLIYDEIMAHKSRYAIMNDCKRLVEMEEEDCECPAYLNGDTEVRWRLKARQKLSMLELQNLLPCIEEDMHLDIEKQDLDEEHGTFSNEEAKLLWQPLPQDLPTVKKTLLLQMAAYDGNIERYARLAGGGRTLSELDMECVQRGILHHSMFARWWADQIKEDTVYAKAVPYVTWIQESIVARRIMVNDYAEFEKGWPAGVPKPYIIWWPLRPDADFLFFLLERCPEMKMEIAAAAIVCDYEHVYAAVNPGPSWDLLEVADFSTNPFYREDQEKRAKENNVAWDPLEAMYRYADLMKTKEYTVLEPYEGRIRDTVGEYELPKFYQKIFNTGDVQLKVWEGVGRVSKERPTSSK